MSHVGSEGFGVQLQDSAQSPFSSTGHPEGRLPTDDTLTPGHFPGHLEGSQEHSISAVRERRLSHTWPSDKSYTF